MYTESPVWPELHNEIMARVLQPYTNFQLIKRNKISFIRINTSFCFLFHLFVFRYWSYAYTKLNQFLKTRKFDCGFLRAFYLRLFEIRIMQYFSFSRSKAADFVYPRYLHLFL